MKPGAERGRERTSGWVIRLGEVLDGSTSSWLTPDVLWPQAASGAVASEIARPAGPAPLPPAQPARALPPPRPAPRDPRHPAPGPARASPGLRCRDLPRRLTEIASAPQQVPTPAADQLELPAFLQPTTGRVPSMRTTACSAGPAPDSDWTTVAGTFALPFTWV